MTIQSHSKRFSKLPRRKASSKRETSGNRVLNELLSLYGTADSAPVAAFLQQNPQLLGILTQSISYIRQFFGPSTSASISFYQDPESPSQKQLDIGIKTSLEAAHAVPLMNRFDTAWGAQATSDAQGKICFLLQPA
jgi:hypothetical protein